jgi:hypothetical protein
MTPIPITHVARLEAFYDGPIPPEALRRARRLDDNAPAPELPPPAPPAPRFRHASDFIFRMAEVMVARETASGACTEGDIAAAGFTLAEMSLYGEAARALAALITADRHAEAPPRRRKSKRGK